MHMVAANNSTVLPRQRRRITQLSTWVPDLPMEHPTSQAPEFGIQLPSLPRQLLDLDFYGQSPAILDFFPTESKVLPAMQRLALRRHYALVDLAQLTCLSVSCNNFRDIPLLLQHIRYPYSARVLLRSVTSSHEDGLAELGCLEVLTAVLARWAQSTSAGLADRMWLVNKFAWDFKIGVALGEVPLLYIHCEEGGSKDQLRHLFHLHTLLHSRCVRILRISGFGAIEHLEEWKELFVRNRQVQRLVLELQEHPRIIQTLTDQSDTNILPQLKSLMLSKCSFDGYRSDRRFTPRVSELLQRRIGLTPLKILKIRQCIIESATVRSLRNIIHVDWDQFLP
ncbi:hypothetical protein BDN71DRAFT_1514024 [Pleurotus eryngii]|uniref:Uncharacterized protein n=1 Tax=Pleurotus eryngii TaxID=5323 RepID=A0A9P5ZKB9_PLEER|nr:hypothetical protein BDN71DRAFT_1514024 [Pleurotus eryngii]